jgi:methylmalonyl-CoA mutase C-terminal domain/subunit
MSSTKPIRILIAKPGLDGHDKGAKLVARGLKDAGMEVIYTGIRQSIEALVQTAIQENVDVIGLSILSGSHLAICKELMEKLNEKCIDEVVVVVGGIIPQKDEQKLKDIGVAKVFRPKSRIDEIFSFIQNEVQKRRD